MIRTCGVSEPGDIEYRVIGSDQNAKPDVAIAIDIELIASHLDFIYPLVELNLPHMPKWLDRKLY